MLDLANHAPNQRAEPYKFKREGFIPYKAQDRPKSGETEESQDEL
jgi:CRISPR-associated endoribonuclease Cas6